MATKYGEVDLKGNLRVPDIKGKEPAKPENLIVSVTDAKIMDRVYTFPKLKGNQLKVAVEQKLRRDLEFIAELSEFKWIYSTFQENNSLKVLVSLLNIEEINNLPSFKGLTITSQVIANFFYKKVKEDFLLVHSFFEDHLVFVFRNGYIDYIRGFKAESSIEESIQLTLEYYKEQKKLEIKTVVFSGDVEPFPVPGKETKSIVELLSKKFSSKYFVPQILPKAKAPFIYKKSTFKPVYLTIPISLLLLGAAGGLELKTLELKGQVENLKRQKNLLQNSLERKERELQKLSAEEKSLNDFFSKEEIKELLNLKKPLLHPFLLSIKEPLKLTSSYILNISGEENSYLLTTITFCKNLQKPKELKELISFLKENPYLTSVTLLNAKEMPEKKTVISTFKITIREESYVKVN